MNPPLEPKPDPKPPGTGLRALGGLGLGLPTGMNAAPSRPQIMPHGNLGEAPKQQPASGVAGGSSILSKLRNTNEEDLKNKLKQTSGLKGLPI